MKIYRQAYDSENTQLQTGLMQQVKTAGQDSKSRQQLKPAGHDSKSRHQALAESTVGLSASLHCFAFQHTVGPA